MKRSKPAAYEGPTEAEREAMRGFLHRTLNEQIGRAIRIYREQKGLTLHALSRHCGVPQKQLETCEKGGASISVVHLKAVADCMGLMLDDFIGDRVLSRPIKSPSDEAMALAQLYDALPPEAPRGILIHLAKSFQTYSAE